MEPGTIWTIFYSMIYDIFKVHDFVWIPTLYQYHLIPKGLVHLEPVDG